jgi:TetR/AcrR family transcriptional repressor for divergent bdcA
VTTIKLRPRGRPRRFDADKAVATAQRLFHAGGYDAVNVADVTDALGINPPSFYSAFGNKAGLYARILIRYAETDALPLAFILRADRPVAESLGALLEEAARRYAAAPNLGCLVLEGTRSNDSGARAAARAFQTAAETEVHCYIAKRHPDAAMRLTDFVSTAMVGLSAQARNGYSLDRLLATAGLASLAIAHSLPTGIKTPTR